MNRRLAVAVCCRALVLGSLCAGLLFVTACRQAPAPAMPAPEDALLDALGMLGLDRSVLSLAGEVTAIQAAARPALVDNLLDDPLHGVGVSRDLGGLELAGNCADYLVALLNLLEVDTAAGRVAEPPPGADRDSALPSTIPASVHDLLDRIAAVQAGLARLRWPAAPELERIRTHLASAVDSRQDHLRYRLVVPEVYDGADSGFDPAPAFAALAGLVRYLDGLLPRLARELDERHSGDWDTPAGRVRIAGRSADRHTGPFLLLIDLGGNDHYENPGAIAGPAALSVVIDLGGDDTVSWDRAPGPGSGILGVGLWIDAAGDDRYVGSNLGPGAGVFGAGLLWDLSGNDYYESGTLGQGAAQYGVGIVLDEAGDDTYIAEAASQGFGGPGGYGLLVDAQGRDSYDCGGAIPDTHVPRILRHEQGHTFSLCQGFGFGMRPALPGGVGLLLDRSGDDRYGADLFAQGAATWLGAGLLTDAGGDDTYQAFEHCQGGGLHAAVGLLADWAGADHYAAGEHCQGAGVDLGVGLLVDGQGDDVYRAVREAQGAGIKPLGRGLLVDTGGDDQYEGVADVQGFAPVLPDFPPARQPLGILVDVGGEDRFRYADRPPPSADGRRQNDRGLAVDRNP